MNTERISMGLPRRRFLLQTGALAAGSALCLPSSSTYARQPKNGLDPFWQDDRIDATWTRHGHIRVALTGDEKKPVCVPLAVRSPDDASMVDWRSGRPVIRFGKGRNEVQLTHAGVRIQGKEDKWSKQRVQDLLETITQDKALARAAISLRTAILATYPHYLHYRRAAPHAKLGARMAKSNKSIAAFGKKKTKDACHLETRIDSVTREVTHEVDVILTAAQQLDRCLGKCEDSYGQDLLKLPQKLLCQGECLGESFVDLVVGTADVVETVVEEVVTTVLVCTEAQLKGKFPNPLAGMIDIPILAGAAPVGNPKFPGDVIVQALKVVRDLSGRLPPAVTCLLNGDWKVTNLEDLGAQGASAIPVGVTVCLDHPCADALVNAGFSGDPIGLFTSLISLAGAIPAAVAGLALAAGVAAVVTQAALAIVALVLILLIHFEIVVGQIFIYQQLNMAADGVCITHPSMPILAIGVVNPILGMLALGNVPLIVTPA